MALTKKPKRNKGDKLKPSMLYIKATVNVALYTVVFALLLIFLPKLIVFFMPFIIGWIISAFANPPVKFLEEKIRFKRKATSAVMIVLILAIVIMLGYGIVVFLVTQGIGFVSSIPDKWDSWSENFETFGVNFNNLFRNLPEELRDPLNSLGNYLKDGLAGMAMSIASGGSGSSVAEGISSGIGSAANILVGIIMCILSAYFITVEHNSIADKMEKDLPKYAYSKFLAAYKGLKKAVGGYFKAQLQIEVWVYIITLIGMLILQIEYSFVIALGIAFMDFLPFFGAGIIMLPWAVIGFANGDLFIGIGMLVTWGLGQLVRQLIQPKIVGDKVGIPPIPTLVLLFVGYKFMGVFGMVVAVPIAMIFISLYEEGLFTTFVESVKILWRGFSVFRRLPEEKKDE